MMTIPILIGCGIGSNPQMMIAVSGTTTFTASTARATSPELRIVRKTSCQRA
jgi:hypothetical protein